jgi:hypothetical protein
MPERTLPGLGLTAYWDLGSNDWKPGMDENIRQLSALTNLKVLNAVATLPGTPTNGDIYLVTSGAESNKIAIRDNGAWVYLTPKAGFRLYDATAAKFKYYTGSSWVDELPTVSNAGGLVLLSVADASSSTALDFTGHDGAYAAYLYKVCQLVMSNSSARLGVRVQQSGTWQSGTGYYKSVLDMYWIDGNGMNAPVPENINGTYGTLYDNTKVTNEVMSGDVTLFNRAGLYPTIQADIAVQRFEGGAASIRGSAQSVTTVTGSSNVTGLRFLPSVGTIVSGKIMCYGMRSTV